MTQNNCDNLCGSSKEENNKHYEVVHVEKTSNSCSLCEDYAKENLKKQVAVISCEGACLRGEISRRIANIICYSLIPEKTVRICTGSAFTKDSGQRRLVKNAKQVIILEGCLVKCASRMFKGLINNLNPEIIQTDKFAIFDSSIFGINEVPSNKIDTIADEAAKKILATKIFYKN